MIRQLYQFELNALEFKLKQFGGPGSGPREGESRGPYNTKDSEAKSAVFHKINDFVNSAGSFEYGDCAVEVARVSEAALEAGVVRFSVVSGGVLDGVNEVDHVWIETADGEIIDPTKSQFKSSDVTYAPKNSAYALRRETPQNYVDDMQDELDEYKQELNK